jgi:hypothetical protein
LPSFSRPFIVNESFVIGRAGLGYVSDEFKSLFYGKDEDFCSEKKGMSFGYWMDGFTSDETIAMLGGEDKVVVELSEIYCLLEELGRLNAESPLLLYGYNLFFVKDKIGKLQLVVLMLGGTWQILTLGQNGDKMGSSKNLARLFYRGK